MLQVTYTRDDRFCLDDQKLVGVGDGSIVYGTDGKEYRTETDSFAKVISLGGTLDGGPNEFRIATKREPAPSRTGKDSRRLSDGPRAACGAARLRDDVKFREYEKSRLAT